MVIRTRHVFAGASFGARSYTTPQVECSVANYDGKPNGWQNYCDCMFAQNDPNRLKCRKRPCANPFDSDPDCVLGIADPRLSFAPWTDVGAGIRGIPKAEGNLLFLFSSSFAPATPAELEPDNFFLTADKNPFRAAFLLQEAGKVLSSPPGFAYPYKIDRLALQTHYAMMGGLLAGLPIIGSVMTPINAAQLFLPVGPLSGQMTSAAFNYAMIKDPSGALYLDVIKPVTDARGSDLLNLAFGVSGSVIGNVDSIGSLVKVIARRAAAMLPSTGAADVEVARALLNAVSESSDLFAKILKDPKTAFTTPKGIYVNVGVTLTKISEVAARAGDKNLATTLLVLGDVFQKLDPSMTAAARAIAEGKPELLCCDKDTAFDLLTVNYLGVKISALVEIADNVAKSGAATSSTIQNAALNSDNAKSAMQRLQDGLSAVAIFAAEIDKALKVFIPAGKLFFSDVVQKLTDQKAKLDAIADAVKAPNPAAAIVNSPVAKAMRPARPMPGFQPPVAVLPLPSTIGAKFPVPKTPAPKTPAPTTGSPIGPVLAAAGVGFLIAGPPGALISGAALALLKK